MLSSAICCMSITQICYFTATVEQPFFLKNGSSLSCFCCRVDLLFFITKVSSSHTALEHPSGDAFPYRLAASLNPRRTKTKNEDRSSVPSRHTAFLPGASVVSVGLRCMGPLHGLQLGTHQRFLLLYIRNPGLLCAVSEVLLFSERNWPPTLRI